VRGTVDSGSGQCLWIGNFTVASRETVMMIELCYSEACIVLNLIL
jgi:hypothetical protein